MKCIKQIILICALINIITCHAAETVANPIANHTIIVFIRNLDTNQVITNLPLQGTYGGFLASSNHNGQIIFPRKTANTEFNLIITPTIEPVSPLLNNISHFQVPAQNEARIYQLSLHKINGKLSEWLVTEVSLPSDRHIPLHSIIIFANSKAISMQQGRTTTPFNNHLILPSIYLTAPLENNHAALTLPNNKPFLARLTTAYNLTPYGYATMQIY